MRNVLVANRGEIARRVFRTCRELGLACTAVFSDADADSPHVREADVAIRLPGTAAADTYLRVDLLVAAARRAGADAVHPGYGFLSENADFARAVLAAGLTWIGPPPDAIDAMGSKVEAKKLMRTAGVPVLDELSPDTVTDFPVIIKASAGGGGRGMRIVRSAADLPAQLRTARAEAQSAFGDPTVFCEPFLETGHHVEVQILADRYGTVWAVGERECSIQRRHQKVIEETPSPLVERTPGMRQALFRAAIQAAQAVDYVGAGTVEFLADDAGRFFFLEMNTRLQVEHPVTELTTGLDLVALQISIAEGGRLDTAAPQPHGSAIEARLYAEDPAADWRPQSGVLHRFALDAAGIRVDSGVEDGSVVGVFYDPMLAKVIAHAATRRDAARRLATALAAARIHGLTTNRDLLVTVLRHPAFLAGETDTAFFDRHGLAELATPLADQDAERRSAAAAARAATARPRRTLPHVPSGWRNLASRPRTVTYDGRHGSYEVEPAGDTEVRFEVAQYGDTVYVDSVLGPVVLREVPRFTDPQEAIAHGSLLAPMPGTITRLAKAVGDPVDRGEAVLWLEAMKMEHQIAAPAGGVLTELSVHEGQQVDVGTVLAVISSETEEQQ